MLLTRCVFAATIHLNKYEGQCSYISLAVILEQLDLLSTKIDKGLNEDQINEELVQELDSIDYFNTFLQGWKIASKIRNWLKEKKKDISNKINKIENEEFNIHKSKEESKTSCESHSENTVDSNQTQKYMQDKILRKEKDHLTIILNKVVKKTELLLKLTPPGAWKKTDSWEAKKLIPNLNYSNEEEENKHSKITDTIHNQLKPVKNFAHNNRQEYAQQVFGVCAASVLSCLQSSMTADEIIKYLETVYVRGIYRWYGLKLMGQLTTFKINTCSRATCFNSF